MVVLGFYVEKIHKNKKIRAGGGVGLGVFAFGGQGGCEQGIEVFVKIHKKKLGGGGGGSSEVCVKILKKKKIFFWGGGGAVEWVKFFEKIHKNNQSRTNGPINAHLTIALV